MVKNENELLGKLIDIQNTYGEIDNSKLSALTDTDRNTLEILMKNLKDKGYIVYTMDMSQVTDFGKVNYISPLDKCRIWLVNICAIALKEIFIYSVGVATGVFFAHFL